MTAWSSLPPEIKQHVVKKLDFMSRHSLRCTSYVDRKIVDSIVFKVPRVRYGFRNERSLVMIYTGIEKFLRWELSVCKDINLGAVIKYERFENTFDPKLAVTKMFKIGKGDNATKIHSGFASHLLGSLLSHKWVRIDAMEFDVIWPLRLSKTSDDQKFLMNEIGLHGKSKFNVRELVYTYQTDDFVKNDLHKHVTFVGLQSLRHLGLIMSNDRTVPVAGYNFLDRTPDGYPLCKETLGMDSKESSLYNIIARHTMMLDVGAIAGRPHLFEIRSALIKYEKPKTDRIVTATINWNTFTKCGQLIQCVLPPFENVFKDHYDVNKCGIGDLCEYCADPFDYWFIQNLPSRAYYEPFWSGVYDDETLIGSYEPLDIGELIEKFEKQEREKKRKQKTEGMKKGRVQEEVESWGFKQNTKAQKPIAMGYEPLAKDSSKNQLKSVKNTITKTATVTQKPTAIQEQESIQKPQSLSVTDASTVTKEPTVIQHEEVLQKTGNYALKYLAVFFVFPISISIIFYFFFMELELNLSFS